MTMPTLREHEHALQRDPTAAEAFLAVRKAYRDEGKFDKLVVLYETRAQALDDAKKSSELFYLAAEIRIDQLKDNEGAEADLAHAVDRDSSNTKAIERLKLIYREQGRTQDEMTLLELQAVALGALGGSDDLRLRPFKAELVQFFGPRLAKLEQAAALPAAQRKITGEDLKAAESGRKIYRALGDYRNVVRLYEIEVSLTADAKRRTDLLLGVGRLSAEKLGDLEAAAKHLGEVLRLRPRDDRASEALASIYADPNWKGVDGKAQATNLFYELACRRHEAGNADGAVATLRKVLSVDPGHSAAAGLLERVLYGARRLHDLDLYYRERVAAARSDEERMDFLFKRAQLAETDLENHAEALLAFEAIFAIEPPGGPASQRLCEIYLASHDYAKLAAVRERQLEGIGDPSLRLAILGELATIYRDRLGDAEQAAVCLHAILQIDPVNREAYEAYAQHFRGRGEWAALVDLHEFTLEAARTAGAPPESLLPRLEEIAGISERNLADPDRALGAWQRMEDLSPGHQRAREAQKRILQKSNNWERMADVLAREVRGTIEPAQKVEILRRLARMYADKLADAEKAIGVYREILAIDPRDATAGKALLEILERERRWAELAALLSEQMPALGSTQEKVVALRQLGAIYQDQLSNPVRAAAVVEEILSLVPGDQDALARGVALAEASGDERQLVAVLERQAGQAQTGDDKAAVLRRLAAVLREKMGDTGRAISCWEQVLVISPHDLSAMDVLTSAYEELGKYEDLARVLDLRAGDPATDPVRRAEMLRRLAQIASGPLADSTRAERAWLELVKMVPEDREALAALATHYTGRSDWKSLAGILERQMALVEPRQEAVAIALERARIFGEELHDGDLAWQALDQIVSDLDPGNEIAYARLRALAGAVSDWPKLVGVAERQLAAMSDSSARTSALLEIGALYRDRLVDTRRAMAAFERALEADAECAEALYALQGLYRGAGEAERLILTNEKLLGLVDDKEDRGRLMFEIAGTCVSALGNARLAFEWYRRAHRDRPGDDAVGRMETLAEQEGLWEDLVAFHQTELARVKDPALQVAVSRKIAALAEHKLADPARAFTTLRNALAAEPDGGSLLPELERLAGVARQWPALLDVYARVARGRPTPGERVDLLRRRAQVRERQMADPRGAMDEWLRAFALGLGGEDVRLEIVRLAEVTGRWQEAVGLEAQLFARATGEERIAIACRAANLVEEKVKDPVRAFRAYLNAFRLAPDNENIIAHLWRLAGMIAAPPPVLASAGGAEDEDVAVVLDEDLVSGSVPIGVAVAPWDELVQAYEQLPCPGEDVRRLHLAKIADIWERGAGNPDRALGVLEKAFRLDTTDSAVRAELWRLAEEAQRWDEVRAVFQRAIDTSAREQAIVLCHELAAACEKRGHNELADQQYQKILRFSEDDPMALARLEESHRVREQWAELVRLVEKRVSRSALTSRSESIGCLAELADIYETRLDKPYEAIDALEREAKILDEDIQGTASAEAARALAGVCGALGRLYGRVDMWPKAASALARQIDLMAGADPSAVYGLRSRFAEILERNLASPQQAVAAYEAILAHHPGDRDALAALDRLYTAQERYEPLQKVLGQLVEVAAPGEKLALISRRSRILEQELGNTDAAASCLRALGADIFKHEDLLAALMRNLRRAGLADEAHRMLKQRIDKMAKPGRGKPDPVHLASLYLELANLCSGDLGDMAGAAAALDQALQADPSAQAVLAARARLFLQANDFSGYAKALVLQADGLGETSAAAGVYLDAGRVFRDQLGDAAMARSCFERAVAADEHAGEALRALAVSLVAEGRTDQARGLFERQLALAETPEAKAPILTDLARTVLDGSGETSDALRFLDQALTMDPGHIPALLAIADVHYRDRNWAEAERRLASAARGCKEAGTEAAHIRRRLADVCGKLGNAEDAYRHLGQADRALPGQLLVKLALGENRYQAKKWREAAAHFEGIAEHPEAAGAAAAVAQGLAHAAQVENNLKRPERAVSLYEAALRLAPGNQEALRGMADLALAHGDRRGAAAYAGKLAESFQEPDLRAAAFEQLGDLYQEIYDAALARGAYEAALACVPLLTQVHVHLMEKVLTLQRAAGDAARACGTAGKLAELEQDPGRRAQRRREAAALLLEQGDLPRACATLEQALTENSASDETVTALAAAYDQAGRVEDVEALLGRTLPGLPDAGEDPERRATRANLWQRWGDLRRPTDPGAALAALERVVEMTPRSVGARAQLAELYGDRPEHREALLQNHRILVQEDILRAPSLRALASAYAGQGRVDRARCHLEVLDVLGLASDADRAFLRSHPTRCPQIDEPYAGKISDEDRLRFLSHPGVQAMAGIFTCIWEGVPVSGTSTLAELGVEDQVAPPPESVLGKVHARIVRALGHHKTSVYVSTNAAFEPAAAVAASQPPAVVVGQPLIAAAEGSADGLLDLRFYLGRSLELARPEYILAATLAPREFTQLFSSVLKAFHPRHARRRSTVQDAASEQAAKLKKVISYRTAKRLADLFQENDARSFSSATWRAIVAQTGDRAGLLACGDLARGAHLVLRGAVKSAPAGEGPGAVAAHASKDGPLRELLRFAVSDEYFHLRERLGTAAAGAATA